MRKLLLSTALAFAVAAGSSTGGWATGSGDPYRPGTVGYDVSYVQCGTSLPAGAFGVVGVNHGRPFDQNPCLATEYGHWKAHALYINTGYDPLYTDASHTTPACTASAASITGSSAQKAAWAAGCSEASKSNSYATSQSATSPSGWWLDVEIANSWSSSDLSLNRYTIQGLVDTLHQLSTAPIGVYASPGDWKAITGGAQVPGVSADWVATGTNSSRRARAYCGTGFSGAPVWLAQFVTSVDGDYAC